MPSLQTYQLCLGLVRELAASIDELGDQLGSHLEDEEQHCFPVIDQALTLEEFQSFGKATAKAVGMRAVLVPHSEIPDEQRGHTQGEPDAVVHRLADLLTVIDRWR